MLTLSLILLPIIAGLITLAVKGETAKTVAVVSAFAELALGAYLYSSFVPDATSQFSVSYDWIHSAGIKFSVGVDGISLILVFLTTLMVPFIILSTFGNNYKNASTLFALILFMQAALVGVFTAKDAFLFYFFFEAALIPVYFIAAIWGGENRIKVTFKFFVYTIFGSLFMLLALVYLYLLTPGTHTADISALYQAARVLDVETQSYLFGAFFIAFAIKMPLFPFHTWQPDTYEEAPTAGTMLLSGIMLKMGVYGLIRFVLPIVPLGVDKWGFVAIILSVTGIVYGSIIAIQQKDMKRLIAYSSFAHVGLMSAGIFSRNIDGIQGALIQMLAHGINVVGLFFIVEIIQQRTQSRELSRLGGITQSTPNLTVYFIILMLGSVALPLTNGFVGEFLLLKGVYEYNVWIGAVAGLTIILGAVYMLRMVQKSMFGVTSGITEGFADLTFNEKIVLFPLSFLVIALGVAPNIFLKVTEPAVSQLLSIIK
ncbi:complex I subunit 4 family protein [Arcicella rigui]|uniref:NADH-quinone oxidoreductase subunit M n=1 Tax=Arcicella rigui TaxID=797020 RepID=A0ABU5Q4Y9_9BACT|nr:NADH-quinone oxidoreductase subunit M [Arcicella rigui]MEA5137647.1 NADH-quinone oxidoreductase subunit M [Arcicella rigui]